MYERGLASTTRPPPSRPSATSATPLCGRNLALALAASSSTTAKPTLCLVSAYFGPGLPSPTTRPGPAAPVSFIVLRSGRSVVVGGGRRVLDDASALGVDLALHGLSGRRGDHVDHQVLRVGAQGDAVGQRDLAGLDLGADLDALDGHLERVRDAGHVGLDLEPVQLLGDQGTGDGVADDVHRHLDDDLLAALDDQQVDVLDVVADRVGDHGLGQRQLRATLQRDGEHGVAAVVPQRAGEVQGRQREVHGLAAAAVEHGRDLAGAARATGRALPEFGTGFGVDTDL